LRTRDNFNGMIKHNSCSSHCCPNCGCKYGYDDCPVATGVVVPEYPKNNGCESCLTVLANELYYTERFLGDILSGDVNKYFDGDKYGFSKTNKLWTATAFQVLEILLENVKKEIDLDYYDLKDV